MYQLEEQIWFWAFLLIPAIVLIYLLLYVWKRRAQRKFAEQKLLNKLSPSRSLFKSLLKLIVLCLAFASLTIAMVNPKIGTKLETVKRIRFNVE